jgi:hypothetical protein
MNNRKGHSMINNVEIYLDDNVPEYMEGLIRCGSVISKDENDNIIKDHQDLIDNTEYHSAEEMIKDVAERLNVSPDIVEIQG